MLRGFLYKIENQINHKVYIGKTYRKPTQRLAEHFKCADTGKRSKLYDAMREFGKSNFSFDILGTYEEIDLEYAEINTIKEYNSYLDGYNESVGGEGQRHNKVADKDIIDFYKTTLDVKQTALEFDVTTTYVKTILVRCDVKEYLKTQKPFALYNDDGDFVKKFNSIEEAVDEGYDKQEIIQTLNGKNNLKFYSWSYDIPF